MINLMNELTIIGKQQIFPLAIKVLNNVKYTAISDMLCNKIEQLNCTKLSETTFFIALFMSKKPMALFIES